MWNDFTVKDVAESPMFVVDDPRAVRPQADHAVFARGDLRAPDLPQKKSVNFGRVIILNEPAASAAVVPLEREQPAADPPRPSPTKPVLSGQSPAKRAASVYTSIGSKMIKRLPRAAVKPAQEGAQLVEPTSTEVSSPAPVPSQPVSRTPRAKIVLNHVSLHC
jgi:hypothetical protein